MRHTATTVPRTPARSTGSTASANNSTTSNPNPNPHGYRRPDYESIYNSSFSRSDDGTSDHAPTAAEASALVRFLCRHVPYANALAKHRDRHDEFIKYQRTLPFKTVVAEPPHTLREYASSLIQFLVLRLLWAAFFILAGPFLLIAHFVLSAMDARQRRAWARFQLAWPHSSVPHVRAIKYTADDAEFPLSQWHLRCEDGRQRWYHGPPLVGGTAVEEGNELGIAQVWGFESLDDLYGQYGSHNINTAPTDKERCPSGGGGGSSASSSTASHHNHHNSNAATTVGSDALRSLPAMNPQQRAAFAEKMTRRERLEKYQTGLWPEGGGSGGGSGDHQHQQQQQQQRRPRAAAEEAMTDGVDFLMGLQDPFSGHWPNDYSGCMFLTPAVIFMKFITCGGDLSKMFPPNKSHVHYASTESDEGGGEERADSLASYAGNEAVAAAYLGGASINGNTNSSNAAHGGKSGNKRVVPCRCGEASRRELIRYLRNHQNDDHGWGQHTEGHSTMLGTVLSYLSLRLLGVPADDAQVRQGREWIRAEGGAVYTPMWGKVWLCILGLFSYDGVPPLLPELVLMPDWVPFSEGRAWCHSRVIAIPFSYFYGLRWSAPKHALLEAIKGEIFVEPFHTIQWRKYRHEVCNRDLYTPATRIFKFACRVMDVLERHHLTFFRRYALEQNWRHIAYDDENTHFICLGPVNKSLNMLVTWIREGEKSPRFRLHERRIDDYLYMGPAGMRMNGYNGSQLWDTSFAVQAVCACRQEMLHPQQMALAHHYIDIAQVQSDPIDMHAFHRHRTRGAWNFSTSPQGWQVSDCTAEGLRVLLLLHHLPFPRHRIFDAVDEVLSLRNSTGDGGWASYESSRAPCYAELMNCAELFKDVMVEYSYAECSSSCIHSLALFREHFPSYRRRDVDVAISEGIACVLGKQRPDGSFYGSWAVCFTYGAWIVADALRVSGELGDMANHPYCAKLINFLLEHQNSDGGWGEDINACVRQVWVDNPDGSQVVNTAWSVMAVMNAAGDCKRTSLPRRQRILSTVERGVRFIMSRQLANGDWAQERISGVFNGNNPIHYPGYKNSMTVWALGRYTEWRMNYVV